VEISWKETKQEPVCPNFDQRRLYSKKLSKISNEKPSWNTNMLKWWKPKWCENKWEHWRFKRPRKSKKYSIAKRCSKNHGWSSYILPPISPFYEHSLKRRNLRRSLKNIATKWPTALLGFGRSIFRCRNCGGHEDLRGAISIIYERVLIRCFERSPGKNSANS